MLEPCMFEVENGRVRAKYWGNRIREDGLLEWISHD